MARNWKRDKFGRFAPKSGAVKPLRNRTPKGKGTNRKVAVVPYARVSLRSTTVGVNSGMNIPTLNTRSTKANNFAKGKRVSFGFYLRMERTKPNKAESAIKGAHNSAIDKIVSKVSPSRTMDPYVRSAITKVGRSQINRLIGGQRRVPGSENLFGRVATSRGGTPSLVLRSGRSHVSNENRAKGIAQYDAAMTKGRKVKNTREQRRNAKKTPVMAESYALKGFDSKGYRVKR